MVCFFKVLYNDIFEYLLVVSFKDRRLFSPISTYFGIIKINSQRILYSLLFNMIP